MDILLYGALILAQLATNVKQFTMKRCGQKTPGAFNSVCINLVRSVICLVVGALIWLFTDGNTTTLFGHIIIVIAGLGTALNLFAWILSSRLVSLTLIECISMIGTLVLPLVIAPYAYAGDKVSLLQWIGCILIFVSVFLFMNKGEKTKKEGTLFQKIAVVAVCAIGATLAAIFKKLYTFHITEKGLGTIEYFTFISFVAMLAIFLIFFAFCYSKENQRVAEIKTEDGKPAKVELPYKKVWVYILMAAVALYANELFTSYASQLPSAIFYPLSRGLVVLGSFLLDVIVFKDKVTVKKIIGLVVVAVAIVLVNL